MMDDGEKSAAAQFVENMKKILGDQTKSTFGLMRDVHKRAAERYRAFLEKQMDDDSWKQQQADMGRAIMDLMMSLRESQEKQRMQFIESQKSMIDKFIAYCEEAEAKAAKEEAEAGAEEAQEAASDDAD